MTTETTPNPTLPPLHPVEVAERAAADAVQTAPAAAPAGPVADPSAPPPAPPAPVNTNTHTPRIYVSFAYDNKRGKQRHDRMWLTGFTTLRRLDEVLQVEAMIAEQKKIENVRILHWAPLEN